MIKAKVNLARKEKEALEKFVSLVRQSLGNNLTRVRLFGSKARGQAHRDADIDVIVGVRHLSGRVKDTVFDIAFDVNLEFDVFISPRVVPENIFFAHVWRIAPFVRNMEKEGIPL